MADPLHILADRLRVAFDAVAGRAGVDPVIRPSEHADAQANGYKLGWVAYRFKARWGHWPQGYRDTRGVDALPEVA